MPRTNRKPRNSTRAVTARAAHTVASQIRHLSDADVYALTFSADRAMRRIADQEAHKRAENYALNH